MSRSSFVSLLFALGVLLGSVPALAGPAGGMGRPDPTQMSGIPRPTPEVPAGELTVRVLRGSFEKPALDAVVQLELRSADGRLAELRSAEAGNQGRVHFRELAPFEGGQAIARVVLDGQIIRSQQIDLRPDMGTAVMLVKGAARRDDPLDEISLPGILFDFPRNGAGKFTVITFDLQASSGIVGADINLDITTPDGQTTTRTEKTSDKGMVVFEDIASLPPGAVLQVRATLDEGEPYLSQKFTPDASRGQAIWLAKGRMPRRRVREAGEAGSGRKKLPGPQVARDLPVGTMQIQVIDGRDQPVADQQVRIVKKDFSGTEQVFGATTNARGVATKTKLPLAGKDGLYYVGVPYDGAPYTSGFFGMDQRGGVRLALRVFEVTDDPGVATSEMIWEVFEAENDLAQVLQVYRVGVGGDKAFWPGKGWRFEGLPDAKSFTILRGAEQWLEHDEKAPYAELSAPLVPGEVAFLSVGYLVEHDGSLEFDWLPPFEVTDSMVVLSDAQTLDAPGAKVSDREIPDRPGLDQIPYDLSQKGTGALRFTVLGLPGTTTIFKGVGRVGGAVLALVLVLGVVLRPRRDTRARLQHRRDELLAALETRRTRAQRERVIAALDRVYRQLDALDPVGKGTGSKAAPDEPKAKA